jgi:hypothetical protein
MSTPATHHSSPPQILTFKSVDPTWPRYAASLPGDDTEWFSSREVRDTYVSLMSKRLGLPIVAATL